MNKNLKLVLLTFVLCILVVGGIVMIRNRAKDSNKLAETAAITDWSAPASLLSELTPAPEPTQSGELTPLGQTKEEKYIENIFKSYESSGYCTQNFLLYQNDLIWMDPDTYQTKRFSDGTVLLDWLKILGEKEFLLNYAVDETDTAWFLFNDGNNTVYLSSCQLGSTKRSKDVPLQELSGEAANWSWNTVINLQAVDSYIYIQTPTAEQDNIYIYDKNGMFVTELIGGTDFSVDREGNLYIIYTTILCKLECGTWKELWNQTVSKGYRVSCAPEGNAVYVVADGQVKKYLDKAPNKPELLFAFGIDTSYRLINYVYTDNEEVFNRLTIDADGTIYLSLTKTELVSEKPYQTKHFTDIYQYCKKAEEVDSRKYAFTVTAPYKSPYLQIVTAAYERTYPDQPVFVDFTYETEEEYQRYQKQYQNNLMLRILAGDIGDVVMTDSQADYYSLCQGDAFLDLSDKIKQDKNYDKLNHRAIEGLRVNGKIAALPVSVTYTNMDWNMTLANQANLDPETVTWEELLDLALEWKEEGQSNQVFMPVEANYSLTCYVSENFDNLVDLEAKTYDLKQQWFMDWLEKYKKLNDLGCFSADGLNQKLLVAPNQLVKVNYQMNWDRLYNNYAHLYALFQVEKEESKITRAYLPMPASQHSAKRTAVSEQMFCISGRTEKEEEAWNFLSFLLEKEMQMLPELTGVAINLEAEEELYYQDCKMQYKEEEIDMEFFEMLKTLYEEVDRLYESHTYLSDILTPLTDEYLRGSCTLEEALTKAEDNLWLRLNE